MAAAAGEVALIQKIGQVDVGPSRQPDAREVALGNASHELIFAVVGHVGSGTSEIAGALKKTLEDSGQYEVHIIKARRVIRDWAIAKPKQVPNESDKSLKATESFQDFGDDMRKSTTASGAQDLPAVARGLIREIMAIRETQTKQRGAAAQLAIANPKKRAFILDALRHPAEVHLLRRLYQEAFVLIGVVCEESRREQRMLNKFREAGQNAVEAFMDRDAKADVKWGQKVADTFHLSDFFVDNTTERFLANRESNPHWDVNEKLSRLIKIVTHSEVVRPDIEETAMHHANGAMMQSACLSRQVGAALIDREGNLIATGTNEVPKAGGGVYGESTKRADEEQPHRESRCAMRMPEDLRFCSNTREQNVIIQELIPAFDSLRSLTDDEKLQLAAALKRTRIGGLLEFSRAVHAEMDALLTAGRAGSSTVGTRLFVSTFPCHYCARHIVSAGVDEVQYIEPYPKSQAMTLHDDSIAVEEAGWKPPSRGGETVLFKPFSGVAPRLYKRAFLKDRELKDSRTGDLKIDSPDWGNAWYQSKKSFLDMERELASPPE